MLLFRSEEHVDRWVAQGRGKRGAVLSIAQLWRLADVWYRDRMTPGWRRRTPDQAQDVFERLGLTGPFWKLRP